MIAWLGGAWSTLLGVAIVSNLVREIGPCPWHIIVILALGATLLTGYSIME